MRNTVFYTNFVNLTGEEQQAFVQKMQSWNEVDGKAWKVFMEFFLNTVGNNGSISEELFLQTWNNQLSENVVLRNSKGFLPPVKIHGMRCNAAWLRETIKHLESLLRQFGIFAQMRRHKLYRGIKQLDESGHKQFLLFIDQRCKADKAEVSTLVVEFRHFIVDEKNSVLSCDPPLLREMTFSHWLKRKPIVLQTLEKAWTLYEQFRDVLALQGLKLCQWLQRMTPDERRDFHWQVGGPAQGRDAAELQQLTQVLIKFLESNKWITKAEVYQKWKKTDVFNGRNAKVLDDSIKALTVLLNNFIVMTESLKDRGAGSVLLLKAIQRRGWDDFVETERATALDAIEDPSKDDLYYFHRMQIEELFVIHRSQSPDKFEYQIYQDALRYSEQYFIILKLQLSCLALSHDQIVGKSHDFGLLKSILPSIENKESRFPPLVAFYYRIYEMLSHPDEKGYFLKARQDLKIMEPLLPRVLIREFYLYVISFCNSQVNLGRLEFLSEVDALYRYTHQHGHLLIDGKIRDSELRNIIVLTTRFGLLDLSKQALRYYSDKLADDADPYALHYLSLLLKYFRIKALPEYKRKTILPELAKEFDLISEKTHSLFYKIDAWVMKWRCLFENENWEAIRDDRNRFKSHLNRLIETIRPEHITRYKSFRHQTALLALRRMKLQKVLNMNAGTTKCEKLLGLNAELEDQLTEVTQKKKTVCYLWLKESLNATLAILSSTIKLQGC